MWDSVWGSRTDFDFLCSMSHEPPFDFAQPGSKDTKVHKGKIYLSHQKYILTSCTSCPLWLMLLTFLRTFQNELTPNQAKQTSKTYREHGAAGGCMAGLIFCVFAPEGNDSDHQLRPRKQNLSPQARVDRGRVRSGRLWRARLSNRAEGASAASVLRYHPARNPGGDAQFSTGGDALTFLMILSIFTPRGFSLRVSGYNIAGAGASKAKHCEPRRHLINQRRQSAGSRVKWKK